MTGYFTFGNIDTRVYGVAIVPVSISGANAQEYDTQSIPGKSGELLLPFNRVQNVSHSYYGIIYADYLTRLAAFRDALLAVKGYARLSDTFNPDEFYMASVTDAIEVEETNNRNKGKFEIVFNRKPQRYLKSGETVSTFTANGTISNPTNQDAKPLIRVYGAGVLGIGDNAVSISSADVYTDIDCEIMEAYKGTAPKNSYIQVQGNDFPVLHPGSNGITLGTGITRVEITPRWWRL